MESAETILVVILSSFLALFLLLGIILIINIMKLVKSMNAIADKARDIVDNVETAAEMFKKASGPMALGRYFVNIANTVINHKKGK
jgi:hypothetical protein